MIDTIGKSVLGIVWRVILYTAAFIVAVVVSNALSLSTIHAMMLTAGIMYILGGLTHGSRGTR